MANRRTADQQTTIMAAVHTHANDRVDDVEFGVLAGLAADALPAISPSADPPAEDTEPHEAAPAAPQPSPAEDAPAGDTPSPEPAAASTGAALSQPEAPAAPQPEPPVGEGAQAAASADEGRAEGTLAAPPAVADLLPDLDYSLVGQHVRPLTLNVTDGFELELFTTVRRLARWRGKRVTREQVFTAAVAAAPRDPDAVRALLETHPTAPDPGADPLRVAVRLATNDHDTLADLQLTLRYDKTRVSLSRLLAAFTAAHLTRLDRALTAAGH